MTNRNPTDQDLEHPPAVSGTPTAWLTLGLVLVIGLLWAFARPVSCALVRVSLAGTALARGEKLSIGQITWTGEDTLSLRKIDWRSAGTHPWIFRSDAMSLRLGAPGWMSVRERNGSGWIREVTLGKSSLLADQRLATTVGSDGRRGFPHVLSTLGLPDAVSAGPIDLVVLRDGGRLSFSGLTVSALQRWKGRLSYDEGALEVGSWQHRFPKAALPLLWEGYGVRLGSVDLGGGLALGDLEAVIRGARCEFGFRGLLGRGLVRGDGSLELAHPDRLDLTLVGESLSLGVLNGLFSLGNRATGDIRQARLTFRGALASPLDADASLRLVARDFHWEGRGWEVLRLSAGLTGRKLTLGELEFHQGSNLVIASGESLLPQDWRQALQAPFTADFRASLEDAASLSSLVGRFGGLDLLSGSMELEGRVRGSRNRAEGYCNLTGWEMKYRDLPLDWIRGCLLFEGDHSRLTYLEGRSGQDDLIAEGTISHDGTRAYSGNASLSVRNLTKRMAQIGLSTASVIGGGACRGSWTGKGELDGPQHSGSFRADVTEWMSRWTKTGMSGSFEGIYSPGRLELGKAEFFQDDLRLSMKLNASRERLTASGISAVRGAGKPPLLEGVVDLPLDGAELWRTGDMAGTIRPDERMSVDLGIHGIRAEELAQLFGQPDRMRGLLEGRIKGSGSLRNPEASLDLGVTGFSIRRAGGTPAPPADLRMSAYAARHEAGLWVDETRGGKPLLSGHLRLPIGDTLAPGEKLALRPVNLLSGDVSFANADPVEWLSLYGADDLPLRGCALRGWLGFGGSPRAPRLSGSLEASAALCDLPGHDPLSALSARLDFAPDHVSVTRGTATYQGYPVVFGGDLQGDAFALRGSLRLSGEGIPLTLWSGLSGNGDLEGDLRVQESRPSGFSGSMVIRRMASAGIPAVNPTLLGVLPDAAQAKVQDAAPLASLPLDLAMKTSAPLTLDQGTDAATITLDLHAAGTLGRPLWSGEIALANLTLRTPRQEVYLPRCVIDWKGNTASIRPAPLLALTRSGMACYDLLGPAESPFISPANDALSGLLLGDMPLPPSVLGRRHGRMIPEHTEGMSRLPYAAGWIRSSLTDAGGIPPVASGILPWDADLPGGTVFWNVALPAPKGSCADADNGARP